jgi:hypothetical protein
MKEQTVVIKEYITKVKVSNSRRPIYYPKFGKIPIIYKKNPDRYIYKEKNILNMHNCCYMIIKRKNL